MKENRLNSLMSKYWEEKTSIEEEAEIRKLLAETEGHLEAKSFFQGLSSLGKIQGKPIHLSKNKSNSWKQYLPYAAVFTLILISGWLAHTSYQARQEKLAYMEVMQAFDLIQENMQKGTSQIQIMGEFKHLNTTHELFNIEETK